LPEVLDFHNFVLDAVLFILFAGRYLWGPADDMLRLALFLFSGWAVVGDMNLYYDWHVPWFDLGLFERQVFGKGIIMLALTLYLLKDYWEIRRKQHIKRLVASTRRGGYGR
jgi:hypothetical protein